MAEDATKMDVTKTFKLPDDFLLGLYIPIHAGLDVIPENFFLYSLSLFATGYSISIGYIDGNNNTSVIATAVISQSAHTPNMSYALPGVDAFDDTVGKLVIGVLDSINLQPTGQFFFDYAGGKLDADCIRPMIRGIQSIRVLNNGELSAPVYGHVILVAGSNMQITLTALTGQPAEIRFDAIDGAGLNEDCGCETIDTSKPIKTINGIGPDTTGNFTMVGLNCLEIDPITNGLQLNDTCSSPCCGCAELEQITQELQVLGQGEQTLRNFMNNLANQVSNFSQVVLGSKLNDAGCVQC